MGSSADIVFCRLYLNRWNHERCYDVLVVAHGERSTRAIIVAGDTLSLCGKRDNVAPHVYVPYMCISK